MKLREEGAVAIGGKVAERAAEERHGKWYAQYGTEEAIEALDRFGGVRQQRRLERELDNLVAACRRALGRGDGETAVAVYRASWAVLGPRGPLGAAVDMGLEALRNPRLGRKERANVLAALGHAERVSGRMEEARSHFESALAIYREVGDRRSECIVLNNLAMLFLHHGRVQEARVQAEAAVAISREISDRRTEGGILNSLGDMHRLEGRMEEARAHSRRRWPSAAR